MREAQAVWVLSPERKDDRSLVATLVAADPLEAMMVYQRGKHKGVGGKLEGRRGEKLHEKGLSRAVEFICPYGSTPLEDLDLEMGHCYCTAK
eukprot:3939102-Rhodomonas_salina.5